MPGLNGRQLAYPRGKVIGGSLGDQRDDQCAARRRTTTAVRQLGLDGWGWGNDGPAGFFLQHQDQPGPDEHHAGGDEWRVDLPAECAGSCLDAVIEACVAAGIPATDDFQPRRQFRGWATFQVNQKGGRPLVDRGGLP